MGEDCGAGVKLNEVVRLAAQPIGKSFMPGAELVWKPCKESMSPYVPFWQVTASDGTVVYVREDGKLFEKLTLHNCIGGGD